MTIPHTTLAVSGERFVATYDLQRSGDEARQLAEAITVEQTIEFPADLIADDDIRRHVIGQIESIEPLDGGRTRARISYAVETSAFELPQLLNVLFGNCSLFQGVRLTEVYLPPILLERFGGPRFGIAGLRQVLGAPQRPLLATALKPMGLDASALASMASTLTRAGIDLIKDDHGISNQPFAPFAERMRACAAAVRDANAQTGGASLYFVTLNGPAGEIRERALAAKEAGVGGLLVIPGLSGIDVMRDLADDDGLGLPIMAHPAFIGSLVTDPSAGMSHGLIFGTLMRLAGADLTVFPGYGGRFTFSREACKEIVNECTARMGSVRTCLPTPGGGMTLARLPELLRFYGNDVALLIGGNLHYGDLYDNARRMHETVEAAVAVGTGSST